MRWIRPQRGHPQHRVLLHNPPAWIILNPRQLQVSLLSHVERISCRHALLLSIIYLNPLWIRRRQFYQLWIKLIVSFFSDSFPIPPFLMVMIMRSPSCGMAMWAPPIPTPLSSIRSFCQPLVFVLWSGSAFVILGLGGSPHPFSLFLFATTLPYMPKFCGFDKSIIQGFSHTVKVRGWGWSGSFE